MTHASPARFSPLVTGRPLLQGDIVFRRLSDSGPNMLVLDDETGESYPHKGAFGLDDDGISVYSSLAMDELNLLPGHLLKMPQNLLVRIAVADISRIEGLSVVGDPWPSEIPDPGHIRNAAHALIKGVEAGIPTQVRRQRRNAILELQLEVLRPMAIAG